MEMQQRRWLEDHSATPQTRWVHENGAQTGDKAIGSAQVGSSLPTAIQDEDLMPSERRFRDDSTKATRFHQPDDGDNRMNENDDDVGACRAWYQISKKPRIQADFVIRHRQGRAVFEIPVLP